jgi:hypothetical protein
MKVVFANGTEVSVTKTSSIYCLGIESVEPDKIEEFKALLTIENLSHFEIVDDEGNTETRTADNFKFHAIDNSSNDTEDTPVETNFILTPLTEIELKLIQLNEDKEINAGAIEDLAELIGGM